jgi:hypothetical protein
MHNQWRPCRLRWQEIAKNVYTTLMKLGGNRTFQISDQSHGGPAPPIELRKHTIFILLCAVDR